MSRKSRHVLSLVLTFVGLFVSGYLAYAYLIDTHVACLGSSHGCDQVKASPYAWVGPIPVPILGLAAYASMLVGLLAQRSSTRSALARQFVFGVALVGTLYSAYLTYLELFVIRAICQWCVASAVVVTALFVLATLDVLDEDNA